MKVPPFFSGPCEGKKDEYELAKIAEKAWRSAGHPEVKVWVEEHVVHMPERVGKTDNIIKARNVTELKIVSNLLNGLPITPDLACAAHGFTSEPYKQARQQPLAQSRKEGPAIDIG